MRTGLRERRDKMRGKTRGRAESAERDKAEPRPGRRHAPQPACSSRIEPAPLRNRIDCGSATPFETRSGRGGATPGSLPAFRSSSLERCVWVRTYCWSTETGLQAVQPLRARRCRPRPLLQHSLLLQDAAAGSYRPRYPLAWLCPA